jgi:hypothetical protein
MSMQDKFGHTAHATAQRLSSLVLLGLAVLVALVVLS